MRENKRDEEEGWGNKRQEGSVGEKESEVGVYGGGRWGGAVPKDWGEKNFQIQSLNKNQGGSGYSC